MSLRQWYCYFRLYNNSKFNSFIKALVAKTGAQVRVGP